MENEPRDYTEEEWRQLVIEANSTELSKRQWCAQAGVSEKQLYYWQHKFRKLGAKEPLETADLEEEPTFVEITVNDSAKQLPQEETTNITTPLPEPPASMPTISSGVEPFQPEMAIQTGDLQLLIGHNISEQAFRTVLKVLRSA